MDAGPSVGPSSPEPQARISTASQMETKFMIDKKGLRIVSGHSGHSAEDLPAELAIGDRASTHDLVESRIVELETENIRLQRLVAELLLKNQQLRKSAESSLATTAGGFRSNYRHTPAIF